MHNYRDTNAKLQKAKISGIHGNLVFGLQAVSAFPCSLQHPNPLYYWNIYESINTKVLTVLKGSCKIVFTALHEQQHMVAADPNVNIRLLSDPRESSRM